MTGFSKEVRHLVRDRASDGYHDFWVVCEVMVACPGRSVALYDLHHRRNRGAGGSKRPDTNQAANALAVCRDCHAWIGAHPEIAYSNGWLVKQHQTPALIPVLRRHHWVLLADDGSFKPADCVCGEIGSDGWVPGPCQCVEEA